MQFHFPIRPSSLLAVALLTGGLAAQTAPCAISVNGDFETGDFSGWQQFPSSAGSISLVSPGLNSSFAANIDNQVAPSASIIKNANLGIGTVMPGETITITFQAKGATANGGVVFVEVFSEIAGGGVSSSVILGGAPLGLNADPNVWTPFRFTTPAGPNVSGGITLQIGAITGAVNGSVSNVTVDDVVVSVDRAAAAWSNYGAGWPGTGGVPTLQLDANPVLGTTVNALIGNVSGGTAIGGIFFGASQAAIATPFGGTLLLNQLVTDTIPMLPSAGGSYPLPIPSDSALCGAVIYAQAIHSDAGASAGVAFTPGLSITLGN